MKPFGIGLAGAARERRSRFCLLARLPISCGFGAKGQLQASSTVRYLFCMHRFGMADLREHALAAVDEAAGNTRKGPVRRSLALRFALAFFVNFADERWPFDEFWRAIANPNDRARWQNANAARNAIRRVVRVADGGD
jgi:hypothetical protein